ncbi:MAG: DUF2087 domain-containing protein [Pseudomonadota bacterium]
MSKEPIPLHVVDVGRFTRSLSLQIKTLGAAPSHVSLLNGVARAAGFRNFQHLRASSAARQRVERQTASVDFKKVESVLQHFDATGALMRWPAKRQVQELCLWVMWAQLPRGVVMVEREVNAILNQAHLFADAALLRRSLIGMSLVTRAKDGTDYRRIECSPPSEAIYLIQSIAGRGKTR